MTNLWAATKDQIQVPIHGGTWDAILQASFIVQLTLLTLLGMSVISWAIMFLKRKPAMGLLTS